MPIVLKSGRLKLREPSRPAQACNGIALPLRILIIFISLLEARCTSSITGKETLMNSQFPEPPGTTPSLTGLPLSYSVLGTYKRFVEGTENIKL